MLTNPIRIPFLPSSIEFERFNIKCFSELVLHLRRVKPRQSSGAEGINSRDSAPMPLVNGSTSPARDEVEGKSHAGGCDNGFEGSIRPAIHQIR